MSVISLLPKQQHPANDKKTPNQQTGRQPKGQTLGIVACGALAREIEAIVKLNNFQDIKVSYLPAKLHNSPDKIPQEVAKALSEISTKSDHLFVAYGDCGTAGKLDQVLEKFNATRLDGAHCYAFYAGVPDFEKLHDAEPGTFYLTDYLARQFDTLVYRPLGLDRYPQLLEEYFGNYTRLLYLSQSHDEKLLAKAKEAAKRLKLRFEQIHTGFGELETHLLSKSQFLKTDKNNYRNISQ